MPIKIFYPINLLLSKILEIIQGFLGTKLYIRPKSQFSFKEISEKMQQSINFLFSNKIIEAVTMANRKYHDEPFFIKYSAKLKDTILLSDAEKNVGKTAIGSDLKPEKAFMKAIGEGIERYCLGIYRKKNFTVSSYDKIKHFSMG